MKKWFGMTILVLSLGLALGAINVYAQEGGNPQPEGETPPCGWIEGEFYGPCWPLFYGEGTLPEGWQEGVPCPMMNLNPENLPEGFTFGPGMMWQFEGENLPEGWPEGMPFSSGMMWGHHGMMGGYGTMWGHHGMMGGYGTMWGHHGMMGGWNNNYGNSYGPGMMGRGGMMGGRGMWGR